MVTAGTFRQERVDLLRVVDMVILLLVKKLLRSSFNLVKGGAGLFISHLLAV